MNCSIFNVFTLRWGANAEEWMPLSGPHYSAQPRGLAAAPYLFLSSCAAGLMTQDSSPTKTTYQ